MSNQPKGSYTQGPWHVGMKPGPMVYGKLGEQIADCRGLDESGYNAKAIAAVPQLVEALKGIKKAIDEHTEVLDIVEHFIEWRDLQDALKTIEIGE